MGNEPSLRAQNEDDSFIEDVDLEREPPASRAGGVFRAALAAAAIALLAWILFGGDWEPAEQEQPIVATEGTAQDPARGSISRGVSEETGADSTPVPAPQVEGGQARTLVAEWRSQSAQLPLDQVYAKAEGFRDTGKLADAHILYFFAARKGHGPSAMALGTMADPDFFTEGVGLMDAPELSQAIKWYRVAVAAGDLEAEKRLERLYAQLETAAATGDVKAQRLLLQWQDGKN